MFRRLILGAGAVALAMLLGAAMVAVLAQEQPMAPVVPGAGAEIKIPDPKPPNAPKPARKAVDAEDARTAKRAMERERVSVDPRAQMASLYARSLASQPAIAVAGDHVYVVKGSTLFQFSVNGLRLLATAELEDPSVAARRTVTEAAKRRKAEQRPAAEAPNP
jgi:hypothetical protein